MEINIGNVQIYSEEEFKNNNDDFFKNNVPEYLKERFKEYKNDINFLSYPAMVWPGFGIENSNFGTFAKM
jgi:hypothetical protein